MNKIKTLFVMALLAVAGNAMADKFTASDVKIEPGQQGEVMVGIENAAEIYAFTFYLNLPEGISLVKDEDEEAYGVFVKGRTAKSGTFVFTKVDGDWMINYFNADIDPETGAVPIKKNSGDVVKLFIKAADTFQGSAKATIYGAQTVDKTTFPTDAGGTTFTISSTSTGIETIKAENNDAPIFTIGGQRVNKAGKGIYVQDGRKVIK